MMPWTDRTGRFSYLKLATFAAVLAPAAWIAGQFITGGLGPLPIESLMDATGRWTIRLLLLSLLVTPVQRVGNWPRLVLVRRMIGLAALSYAGAHLIAYVANQSFDLTRVLSEISQRFYLAVGFLALLGLIVLGATSTDAAIRRLGQRWKSLHKTVYAITALGVAHFFLQTKIDATEPTLMAGFLILLMMFRVVMAWRIGLSPLIVLAIGLFSALATAGLEYAWYELASGIDAGAVLAANLAFPDMVRPAVVVTIAGFTLTVISFARSRRRSGGGIRAIRSWARA
jgi:sulfoxide reductase heme-binding subunit YedZ